jgi:hypothetical protein
MFSQNALWFSPKRPTEAQRAEIARANYELTGVEPGIRLATHPIEDRDGLRALIGTLRDMAFDREAGAIYGDFPVILISELAYALREQVIRVRPIPCYVSWAIGSGHQEFVWVGVL